MAKIYVVGHRGMVGSAILRQLAGHAGHDSFCRMKFLGWQAKIALEDGVSETYSWFLQNNQSLRG
jgi:nucleoside-diphosphate-sugar epimerase